MGNLLISLGIILIVFGLFFNFFQKINLPLLPGDIFIQKENFTFYFPIVTSLIISLFLTIIINLIK